MTDRGTLDAAGGPIRHTPVLLAQVIDHLDPAPDARMIDGTFGAGGYSRALLDRGCRVLAIDRDPDAIREGRALEREFSGRLTLVEGRFSDLDAQAEALGFVPVDGVVLDVGVSSMQLDDAGRGFSFLRDGPLDMRMSGAGVSAADIVNRWPRKRLTRIIGLLGGERRASAVAKAVERRREARPFETTLDLAETVAAAVGGRGGARIHPATRTFQALRIFINRELEELAQGLSAAESVLKVGGRLVVVAFHSLEDRIVKRFLQDRSGTAGVSRHLPPVEGPAPTFSILTRRPVVPGKEEVDRNVRARSAKLRAAIRLEGPARALDMAALGVPRMTDPEAPA